MGRVIRVVAEADLPDDFGQVLPLVQEMIEVMRRFVPPANARVYMEVDRVDGPDLNGPSGP